MSIAKPFTFVANTYAKASEVNADFDTVYAQVNSNISAIATNATDIDNLENNKADINGSSAQRFAVADPVSNGDAVNKQSLMKAIGNSLDYISGLTIAKDSGSPDDTIIVSAGSAYDSTKAVVLTLSSSTSKQNLNQAANATYYVYIIGNSTGSSVDILISTSSTTPTLPAGYTLYRLIGSYTTNSDSEIETINYFGIDSDSNKNISGGIISGVMPNYSAGITVTSGDTMPSDGIIVINAACNAGWYRRAYVNSVEIFICGPDSNTTVTASYLVSKGDIVTHNVDGWVHFYPAKGVN